MAGHDRLQRAGEAVRLDLGEEAEPAEVHAEHGHLGLQHEPERAQQRAVAAEHHHQVEPGGELLRPEAGDVPAEAAALLVQGAQLHAPLGRPAGQLLAQVERCRPARVDHRADPPQPPGGGHQGTSPAAPGPIAGPGGLTGPASAGDGDSSADGAASAGWARGPPWRGRAAPSATAASRASSSSGPAPARRSRNSSTLPEGPGSGEGHTPAAPRPSSAAAAATERTAAAQARGSRTTPPLPTASLPASNCGLTSSSSSPSGRVAPASAGSTSRREMNDRSATVRSTGPPIASGSSLSPPRLAQRRPGEASSIGSAAATILEGLAAGAPETSTRPAATASAAASRLGTSPRRTSSRSSRTRAGTTSS